MTDEHIYRLNTELKIWESPSYAGSTYSDGQDVEDRLLTTLKLCRDVSAFSEELRNHIVDWPTEYHLSPTRHNLLRLFPFGPGDCILELGCGCGAMTRYLGETGAKVIAVEGSRRRATIAAERCRDLSNVTIYCDNLLHFESTEQFSHVTLIGVLEYARVFIHGPKPELQCLQSAVRWLDDDGQLLLAIENQFGLKYFNGCAEDHIDIPGFGLHDLYTHDSPVTFGHFELQQLISQVGLTNQEWVYPLPDYKLPTHLVHSRALSQPGFALGDLLHDTYARDYSNRRARSFHEGMAWRGLARNQLLPALANSFLVRAQRTPLELPKSHWLAATFNTQRLAAFCTQTTFVARPNSAIEVHKQCLADVSREPTSVAAAGLRHVPVPHSPYVDGCLHAAEFQRQAARGRTLSDLQPWLSQWLTFLRTEQLRAGFGSEELPAHLLDAIPCNLVSNPNGQLQLIDIEWCLDAPIPMSWVLIRGMVKTLASAPPVAMWRNLTFQQATTQLMCLVDISLRLQDFTQASQLDAALQQLVLAPHPNAMSFERTLAARVHSHCVDISSGRGERELQDEIDRIKGTWSWRMTGPLRALANSPRLLRTALRRPTLRT